jgi:exodeoxyribonuclease-3
VLLASWNVNSLNARLFRVLEFLELHRPDVVCLQETKTTPEAFPHDALAEIGYRAADHSGGRWEGVAIVARDGLEISDPVRGLAGEPTAGEARWIEATVGGLRVASVYVPNGRAIGHEMFAQKLAFLGAMAERAGALHAGATEAVVQGDMNVCPADRDVYDPAAFAGETHVTDEERAALAAVLERGGLVDAFRQLEPEEPGFTWWDYRQGHFHRKMGLRIDLALLSGEPASRLESCGIDRNFRKGKKPSDHAPLLTRLRD